MVYRRRNTIPQTNYKGRLEYEKYKKVHDILNEHDELFNNVLFHNAFKLGCQWVLRITDDDIEQARQDEEEKEKKGKVYRLDEAKVSEQLSTLKRIAEVLTTTDAFLDYIEVSKEFFQPIR